MPAGTRILLSEPAPYLPLDARRSARPSDTVSQVRHEGFQNLGALRSVGVAFGLFAAGLVIFATFMARLHSPTVELQHKRLIDRNEGPFFVVCAAVMIVGATGSLRGQRAGWLLVLSGLAVLGLTIYSATGSRSLVLHAVPGVAGAVHGELALGLGLSGCASLLAASGGGLILSAE